MRLARKDGPIGVLVLNDKGEVKTEKVGKRSTGKGAGIGLALGLLTPVGLAVGIIGGGALGALHHKGLGLDKADRERIGAELGDGKAAISVTRPARRTLLRPNSPNSAEPRKPTRSPMKLSRKPTLPLRPTNPRRTVDILPPRPLVTAARSGRQSDLSASTHQAGWEPGSHGHPCEQERRLMARQWWR